MYCKRFCAMKHYSLHFVNNSCKTKMPCKTGTSTVPTQYQWMKAQRNKVAIKMYFDAY